MPDYHLSIGQRLIKLSPLCSVSNLVETFNNLSQLQLSVAVTHLSFEFSQHVGFALTKSENLSYIQISHAF